MQQQIVLQRFVSVQCLAALLLVVLYDEDLILTPRWFVSMIDWPWWIIWSLAIWVVQFWVARKLSSSGWKTWHKLLAGLTGPLMLAITFEVVGIAEGYTLTPDTLLDTFSSYVLWFVYCMLLFLPAWIGLFLPKTWNGVTHTTDLARMREAGVRSKNSM